MALETIGPKNWPHIPLKGQPTRRLAGTVQACRREASKRRNANGEDKCPTSSHGHFVPTSFSKIIRAEATDRSCGRLDHTATGAT